MMKEICKEHGIPEPKYGIGEIEKKLIFQSGGKAVIISEIKKLGVELNERQRKAISHEL